MNKRRGALLLMVIASLLLTSIAPSVAMPPAPKDERPGQAAPRAILPLDRQLENVVLLGQIGGEINSLDVIGNVAYVGVGPRLVILDISLPASPVVLGQTAPLSGVVQGVFVEAGYAYLAAGEAGLYIVNVANPANPVLVGPGYDTLGFAQGVMVAQGYACVADGPAGLVVLDVSNPLVPQLWYSYDTPGYARSVTLYSEPGSVKAYLADGAGGLYIFSVAPSASWEGVYNPAGIYAEDVAVDDDIIYVADGSGSLLVVDVFDEALPTLIASLPLVGYPDGLDLVGDNVFLGLGDEGFSLVNVFDPAAPFELGFLDTPGWAYDAASAGGNTVLVADGSAGVRVIGIANPALPQELSYYSPPGIVEGVAAAPGYAYTAEGDDGLGVIDVSLPATPAELGALDTPGYAWAEAVAGATVYVADDSEGLRLVDVSNPANPMETGAWVPPPPQFASFEAVALYDHYALAADSLAAVRIIDVLDAMNPAEVATYVPLGPALDVAVDPTAGLAYVVGGDDGLHIADIYDPLNPFEIGIFDTPGYAQSVAVYGPYAFVADGPGGLRIFDVSDPAATWEVASYPAVYSEAVASMGAYYVFIANGPEGLAIIDATDPANPTLLETFDTPGAAVDVAVLGGYVYVADADGGLWVLQFGEADVSVTKTDGQGQVYAGDTLTYTVQVSNAGPDAVAGAAVVDDLPAALLDVIWLCDASPGSWCPEGSGEGDFDTPVDLLPGGYVVFTVTGTIDLGFAGPLTNTVSVEVQDGVIEPDPLDNSADDVDLVLAGTDLVVTKTDGQETWTPGTIITYTIVVSNTGPLDVLDAIVEDEFAPMLFGPQWTCQAGSGGSCGAPSGSGDISTTVDLAAGAVVTFTASARVAPAAGGLLVNTAHVEAPAGVVDTNDDNNSATDTDLLTAAADLSLSKWDSPDPAVVGQPLTYTLAVWNAGPSAASDVALVDTLPAGVALSWASPGCITGTGVVTCELGALGLDDGVTVTLVVLPSAAGQMTNTAVVTAEEEDPVPGNNIASATTTVEEDVFSFYLPVVYR